MIDPLFLDNLSFARKIFYLAYKFFSKRVVFRQLRIMPSKLFENKSKKLNKGFLCFYLV